MKKDEPNEAPWISHRGGNQNGLGKALYLAPEPNEQIMVRVKIRGTVLEIENANDRKILLVITILFTDLGFGDNGGGGGGGGRGNGFTGFCNSCAELER